MPKQTTLNKRQMKFVEYIMKGEGQTRSAILAGFSEKSAKRHAHDLMRNSLVIEEIERQQKLHEEAIRKAFLYDAYKSQRFMSQLVDKEEAYDRDRLKAAEGILDRAGFRAADPPQINNTVNNAFDGLSTNDLLALLGKGDSDQE